MIVPTITGATGSYDSELGTKMMDAHTNAELTLILKICLQKAEGFTLIPRFLTIPWIQDADGRFFHVVSWPQIEWEKFRKTYCDESTKFWNGKFWLISPGGCVDLRWPEKHPNHRCNIWCRFRMVLVDAPNNAHKTIQVAKLAPRNTIGSCIGQNCNSYGFRSHSSLYKSDDLNPVVRRGASYMDSQARVSSYTQPTVDHEVGHALGLPHIAVMTKNAKCKVSDTNAPECYGTTLREAMDIMGEGGKLSLYDAKPWLDRIDQHFSGPSPKGKFSASLKHVFPTPLKP